MVKVIKRSGKEEEYLSDKIYNSLINNSVFKKIGNQIVKKIDEKVKNMKKVSTKEIREYILNRLQQIKPEIIINGNLIKRYLRKNQC
ncbi:hypothetical protein YN1_1310 [Nanoarchaeota archaeon]